VKSLRLTYGIIFTKQCYKKPCEKPLATRDSKGGDVRIIGGLDSKHNTFIKTFMMNDERNKCIDTRPGPSMRMEFDWLYSVQALCKTKEPTRYLEL